MLFTLVQLYCTVKDFGGKETLANLANHPKVFPPIFKTLSSICGHLLWNKLHHHAL